MDMQDKDNTSLLLPGERTDDLQRKNYRIIQNGNTFCFGIDAVLLSDFAKIKKDEHVMDFCTGNGIIPILLEAKTAGAHFSGLEIQEYPADMAKRSVLLNQLEEKIDIICGDVCKASSLFPPDSFDVITCNPPYMNHNHGLTNPELPKAIARHELLCTLEDIVREAAKLLKHGGRFYMIHRPFRLVEIFQTLTSHRLEPKAMRLVQPYADKEPNMVLVEAVKGGNSMIKIAPPLIIYEAPNIYTKEVQELYQMGDNIL